MGSALKFAGASRSRWQSPSADVHPNKSCSNYSRHFSSQPFENGSIEGTIYDKAETRSAQKLLHLQMWSGRQSYEERKESHLGHCVLPCSHILLDTLRLHSHRLHEHGP